jgi:uncharacterized protein with HEPN domain
VPPRNWEMRIGDILDCIAKIRRHTQGLGLDEFTKDDKTMDAVIRNLEIIGEAARNIPAEIRERYPKVPWLEMQTMRNIVLHEYHGVNVNIIWQTVTDDLPPLVPLLQKILEANSE